MVQRPLGNHHDGPDTLLVTSDAKQTGPVTAKGKDATEEITEMARGARVVLWDFDGPICGLFAGHSAQVVADGLVKWLEGRGLHGLVTENERDSLDPQVLLRAVGRRHPGSDLVAELEERLTKEELRATSTAMPTAFADILVQTWRARGARMAVTTDNSPRVVRAYLDDRGLTSCFAPHIYGRTRDLHHLKPDPHCLRRALSAMGTAPGEALMIGDSPTDLQAAERAGVPFLGYARNDEKTKLLTEAGAGHVVGSLQPLLMMLRN
ncbi:HAD family hydrolase [Streptomyces fuscichromogenes]|uniref:HAD family hydrolase n=1 Tax=Streptomyces fuscichromogenes TaxID=1324013 RepID=UPI001E2F5DEB|nr:HAD family hydrolase [Streptomyces fuscichromogenes]